MGTKKSKVNPDYKTRYKVRNWGEYDRALARRGEITLWLTPGAIAAWSASPTGRRGRPPEFSDVAIEAALMVRLMFGLPRRQTEGLLNCLLSRFGLAIRSPNHTTPSRRSRGLGLVIPPRVPTEPLHVVMDATGLKVFGRGE